MIPKDWKTYRFQEIFKRVTRKNTICNSNILTISSNYGLINQRDFFNKRIAADKIDGYYLIKKGEFAYNKSYSNGYPLGAIKRLDRYEEGVLSTLYICFKIFNPSVNNDFLTHYFEAGILNKQIYGIAQEGARNHGLLNISVTDFFGILLYLPPLTEQCKIAEILSTWDKAIALLEQLITAKRKLKQGLMQQLLTGKKRFNSFPDWQEKCIGDLITFSGGSQPPRSTFVFEPQDGYIRLIQIRDYKTDNFATFIPKNLAKKFCSKDDVMIGRYGPPIFQILKGIEGAYNVALIKAIPNKELNRDYMFYFLKQEALYKFVESLSQRTSGQTGIEMDQLKEYPFPLPSIPEQIKIASILSAADTEISNLEKQLAAYKQQKRGLMQQLLTGKKRVKLDEPQMQKV